jgi:membrane associated rhomboid family serine protease
MFNKIIESFKDRKQTAVIILINCITFLTIEVFLSQDLASYILQKGLLSGISVYHGDWWRILTSGYLHIDFEHLFFNSLILWIVGKKIEGKLGRYYFAFYNVIIIISSCFSSYLNFLTTSLGSSGGVFGIIGFLSAYSFKEYRNANVEWNYKLLIPIYLTYITVNGLVPNSHDIDYVAHISGFFSGLSFYFFNQLFCDQKPITYWGYSIITIAVIIIYNNNMYYPSTENITAINQSNLRISFLKNYNQCLKELRKDDSRKEFLKSSSCKFLIHNSNKIDKIFANEATNCIDNKTKDCKILNSLFTIIGKAEESLPYKKILCNNKEFAYCNYLGDYYLENNLPKEAVPYFEMSCKANNAIGCTQLSSINNKLGL